MFPFDVPSYPTFLGVYVVIAAAIALVVGVGALVVILLRRKK